ncbi:ankyrin repeat domain-containing protein 7 [Ursus arctos]|uniref:ankyrin repeat domain-containing protein 7 n=1 Tax=Ursus arctos TaxID=9644 RepID=UPI002017768A|nr:ankyrin repeat domain-containing protein 7 [Ursus arctos]
MKKLFTFWRRKDQPHSPSSHLPVGGASTHHPTQPGYNLRDKDLKKLHKAASVGDLEKVKEYLQLKKHDVNIRDRKYRTPLHLACANGYSNIVSLLIEKKCKINVCDSEKRSPLTKAVQCAKEDCATILLSHGADPNLADLDGNTALHYAVCGQSISLVEKLLEHKANLEDQNKDGYTPLLLAITENNAKMVEYLLKRGADVNASDKNQRTALMIALNDEPTNLVSLLLQQEVDLSCQDIYGFTAEEYASFNGFTVYHQLIANYGRKKNVEQMSDSEDTTLGTVFDTEELKEDRQIQRSFKSKPNREQGPDSLPVYEEKLQKREVISKGTLMLGVTTARTASVTLRSRVGSGGSEKQETWGASGFIRAIVNDQTGCILSWKGRRSGSPGPLAARGETAGTCV